jgi:cell division protein FtsZ
MSTDDDSTGWASFGRPTSFAVVGLGGAGCEAVSDLLGHRIPGVRSVAINTDAMHLQRMPTEQKILIGHRTLRGRGSGGDRAAVVDAAEESREELIRELRPYEVVFLLAATGGGTGSALLPYLSRELRCNDIFPIPIAFLPFAVEVESNRRRREMVQETLDELVELGGLLLVIANEKLRRFGALPLSQALQVRNAYLHGLVSSLVDMVENPSQLNVDLATVKNHLASSGLSTVICGESHVTEPERLVPNALRESLLDFELEKKTRALVHIEGGSNLTVNEFDRVMNSARFHLNQPEELLFGTRLLGEPRETVRLTGIVGGIRLAPVAGIRDTPRPTGVR